MVEPRSRVDTARDVRFMLKLLHAAFFLLTAFVPVLGLQAAEISLREDTVHYSGPITDRRTQRLFAAVRGKDISRLVITSGGGEVEAAIALASWVFEQGLDVDVSDYCLSSCANYVFPAGHRKTIQPGAVVAWHGNYHHLQQTGLWRDDIPARMERYGEDAATATEHVRAQVERLVRLEREFFDRIGVDQFLCWIGKIEPYSTPNYYFLSARDMARFGVANVNTPRDYMRTDVSGFEYHIEAIALNPGHGPDGPGKERAGMKSKSKIKE